MGQGGTLQGKGKGKGGQGGKGKRGKGGRGAQPNTHGCPAHPQSYGDHQGGGGAKETAGEGQGVPCSAALRQAVLFCLVLHHCAVVSLCCAVLC